MNWELIISGALIANFITWYFQPLDSAREYIVEKWINFFVKRNMFWATRAIIIITCAKCLAFWSILVYTLDLMSAIIASMLALIIKYIMKYVEREPK
jgi:hypothetical protein